MKRKVKEMKGITLVALVVTIVVLLILAGITINMLFSDNGIISKAQEAADRTAEDNTENGLSNLENQMLGALGGKETAPTTKQGEKVPADTLYANFVAKTDDDKDINVPVPGGYTVVENTEKSNKINDGIVIQDDIGNQFVWVPVNDEEFTKMYDATNKRGNLYVLQEYNVSTNTWTTYETPKIKEYSATGLREPDYLKDTSNGDANPTGINQLKVAVGIKATAGSTDENQSILDNWKAKLEKEFDNMIKSVKEYKGFYIGRYETGDWSNIDCTKVPKVQKGQTVGLLGTDWYEQYAETKNLKANNNVTTSMIWGCQYDRTLEWIAQTNEGGYSLIANASSWGNYSGYKDATGDTEIDDVGKETLLSGTNSNWQKNNIFDLAGNAGDWTIEACNNSERSTRGGLYNFSGSDYPFERLGVTPQNSGPHLSSRSTLYINLKVGSEKNK